MAEMAVSLLCANLNVLMFEEVKESSLVDLEMIRLDLMMILEEMERMRAFLADAEKRQHTDVGVKVWVKQVRDTAYEIEDVIDEFIYRMKRPSGRGLAGITSIFRRIKARNRMVQRVHHLRDRLREISKIGKFSFSLPAAGTSNFGHHGLRALFVEESQLIGIEKPREEMIEKLLNQKRERAVVSVVGMGGVGKTTLVRKVYEDWKVENHFVCHAWVTVSQTYSLPDLLKSIIKQFKVRTHSEEELYDMNYLQLFETLRAYLGEKRYLIVLDDVWSIDAWDKLNLAFPENDRGSRIIMTTRNTRVADYCSNSGENVYRLEPLSSEEAWTLFCKKVFGDFVSSCPPELEQPARGILEVCGGLPLAIVVIAGVLSTKGTGWSYWQMIYRSMQLELEMNDSLQIIKKILFLSYDDLPYPLKPCFLYFSIYPDDYIIKTSEITQLWIAEGFIKPTNDKNYEEVSMSYLNELVQRSLVQASERDYSGRVRRCHIHDLWYDLISLKSREENFLSSWSLRSELPLNVRRLVVSSGESVPQLSNFSHLRSLLLLGTNELPLLPTFKVLRVLHLKCGYLESFPTEIFNLFHLRYLYLGDSSYISNLPKDIRKLGNLQILCLKGTRISQLPDEILELKYLRHIMMHSGVFGVEMPEKLGSLTSLETLEYVDITGGAAQLYELSKLTQLKKLRIERVKATDGQALCKSISNMKQLQSLYLFPGIDSELLDIETLSVDSTFLRSINLRGLLKKLPGFISSLYSLQKLRLNSSKLKDDPFLLLEELPSLVELYMHNNAYEGEELHSKNSGFQKLKKLIIQKHLLLRCLVIDQGAMPYLEFLGFTNCGRLKSVPIGIEHLRNLKELSLEFLTEECMNRVRKNEGEDWKKVEHIPIVRKAYHENLGF